MKLKNKKLEFMLIILVLFMYLFFMKGNTSFGIYRDNLNTKIYLSILDTSSTVQVNFLTYGGDAVNPMDVTVNTAIGMLPTTGNKEGYNFVGWYTGETTGNKVTPDTVITGPVTFHAHWVKIVCKKAVANTLHTETCLTGGGCLQHNYSANDTITYGTIFSGSDPVAGNAYNCDVNGDDVFDPVTERFYYVRSINDSANGGIDKAALVYYTSFDNQGRLDSSNVRNMYEYEDGKAYLPSTTFPDFPNQYFPSHALEEPWDNTGLITFNGKKSRYITRDDLVVGCGEEIVKNNADYLSSCQYFLENSRYQASSLGLLGIWIKPYNNNSYYIETNTATIQVSTSTPSYNAVRPMIEIPYNAIDGYRERTQFDVTIHTKGGTISNDHLVIYDGDPIGAIPEPEKDGFTFTGWFTDDGTFQNRVTASTVVTGNMHIYAKWEEVVGNLQYVFYIPGVCKFNGSSGNITSDSNDCVSIINTTSPHVNIDYAAANTKYIDTGIALYNEDNYELNYEVGFTILAFNGSNTYNPRQATIFNSKLENESLSYPGLVFRKNNGTNFLEITQTIAGNRVYNRDITFVNPITEATAVDVKIIRKDGVVSFSYNGSTPVDLQDINNTSDYFEHFAWFGTAGTSVGRDATTSSPDSSKYLTGTISNLYIKLEQENLIYKQIDFNPHAGTCDFASKTIPQGNAIGALPNCSLAGYHFDGWYTSTSNGRRIDSTEIVAYDVEYHAMYTPLMLVTFYPGLGTLSTQNNSMQVPQGSTISDMPTASLSGYFFDGWYTQSNGGTKVDENTVITNDIDLYAQYIEQCTIYFDPDGGTASFTEKIVGVNRPIGELPTATKTDMMFVDWFTDNTYATAITEQSIAICNNHYIAKWRVLNPVAMVNNEYYESLQDAIDAVDDDGVKTEVTLLQSVTETVKVTIAQGQNIELNLQTYTLTNATEGTILNNGTLEIKNGTINCTATSSYTIENNGILLVTGGLLKNTKSNVIVTNGTTTMTGGTLNSSAPAGAINIESGASFTMIGGTINATGSRQAVYNNGGTVELSGTAELSSKTNQRATVQNHLGNMTIKGNVTITSDGSMAVQCEAGNLIIGEDDGTIDTTNLVMKGATYGLQIDAGNVTVYDGLFKGLTKGINDSSVITILPTTSFDESQTEIIGTDTYNLAFLITNP